MRKFDSALVFAQLTFTTAEKLNRKTDADLARLRIAATLIRLKKMQPAEKELDYFRINPIPWSDASLTVRYETILGNYFLANDDKRKSKLHYDSAFAVLQHNSFPELLIIIYNEIAGSYYELH